MSTMEALTPTQVIALLRKPGKVYVSTKITPDIATDVEINKSALIADLRHWSEDTLIGVYTMSDDTICLDAYGM